jgi:hypothetical protein
MKKLLALGLTCCIPAGLAAEDSTFVAFPMGTESVLVIDDAATGSADIACARDCVTVNRAVLTGHMQRVPVRDRARWM